MRLFVAIEAPEAWRAAAAALQQALPPAVRRASRLVDPELMHVTLRFIGEVAETELDALHATLEEALPPVEVPLELGAVRTFGTAARTSVVWLGVGGEIDRLRELAGRADAAVDGALRLPPEERRFHPHLTLARVRNQVRPEERRAIAEAARALEPPPPEPFVARQAVLVQSHLGPEGARYRVRGRYGGA